MPKYAPDHHPSFPPDHYIGELPVVPYYSQTDLSRFRKELWVLCCWNALGSRLIDLGLERGADESHFDYTSRNYKSESFPKTFALWAHHDNWRGKKQQLRVSAAPANSTLIAWVRVLRYKGARATDVARALQEKWPAEKTGRARRPDIFL